MDSGNGDQGTLMPQPGRWGGCLAPGHAWGGTGCGYVTGALRAR